VRWSQYEGNHFHSKEIGPVVLEKGMPTIG
jgi:hypothetical protein